MWQILSIKAAKQLPKDSDFVIMGVGLKLSRRLDRNNNPYREITISDATGDVTGKAWSGATWYNNQGGDKFPIDPDNCGINFEGLSLGIVGRTSDYREQLQFNFTEVYVVDQNKYPPQKFMRRSPLNQEFLESEFNNLIERISYVPLKNFVKNVFFKHGIWEKFREWPAAVMLHHAYYGGLLEHSVSVTLGALDMSKHYKDFKIPVEPDILIAGGLLHDIGKLEAYEAAPVPQMKPIGNIIEHVSLGYHTFMKFSESEGLESKISTAVGHIILSHHGKFEYGSPVLPQTPEAMLVSASDDIDFKLAFWKNQIEELPPQNEHTDYISFIGYRLWRGVKIDGQD